MAHELRSASGLRIRLNQNGSIERIEFEGRLVNLFPGNELEGGPANLYLRRRGARIDARALLGPTSPAALELAADALRLRGSWDDIHFRVALVLAESAPAWFWHLELENRSSEARELDLVYAQDLALADPGAVRNNEYYVSQYVDYTPLEHPEHGVALAVRQNLGAGGAHPLALVASLARAVAFATDALQLHGTGARSGLAPSGLALARLPGRWQHEHSLAALQDEPIALAPGAAAQRGFCVWLEADHPAASSAADLALLSRALALPEAAAPGWRAAPRAASRPVRSLFCARPPLAVRELAEHELGAHFPGAPRELERAADGALLSFFRGADRHVVLRAKELRCLRAHGQILKSGSALVPDEASLCSTVWMGGAFHSLVTQGHVGIGRFLSATRSYLGLFRCHGLRVFAELGGAWHQLGTPSAFEMAPDGARWIYEHAEGCLELRSRAALDEHLLGLELEVRAGAACRFLVSLHVAVGGDDGAAPVPVRSARDASGIAVRFAAESDLGRRFPEGSFRVEPDPGTELEQVGGDELLFADGVSREQPFLVLVTAAARSAGLCIRGELVASGTPRGAARAQDSDAARTERFWRALSGPLSLEAPRESAASRDVARLQEILRWFAHDAWIHYLAPRGLEQFSGGGWGTRDVCQGPVEWLLSIGRHDSVRDLLLRVFRAQNPDGDWPQWFTFFERDRGIRAPDSHGDVVFWPLLALARYLEASGDASLLDARIPFFHPEGDARAEHAALQAHAERALALAGSRVIPGSSLAAYGHGDWDDSLQPADPALRERLCSSWTVALQHETLRSLARALRGVGRAGPAAALEAAAAAVRADFQRELIGDGVVAGFALFDPEGRPELLFHPRDGRTGVRYRLLSMIHAITGGLFTAEQARAHLAILRAELLAPDGARLLDRPLLYRGGVQHLFQRAESSSFFGREIGLMYMHAHLRYAEAMAQLGEADALWLALRQANPIGIRDAVPPARLRQANCYATSSDAAVADRYESRERYRELLAGRIPLEGGWRVYSSGPGIALGIVRERFLGLSLSHSALALDPVIPRALDGLRARVELAGRPLEIVYRVRARGAGPLALYLDGEALAFERGGNPYRRGAARIALDALRARLRSAGSELVVELE